MSDEQDDNHGLVGWIIGLAAAIAIAVALLFGIMGALNGNAGKAPEPLASAAPASPAASPAASTEAAAPAAEAAAPVAIAGSPEAAKLYFDSGSFATPAGASETLAALIAYSKSSPDARLSVSGYHDKTGDFAQNQELAKNRAKVVKDLLLAAGVPEDHIVMQKPIETTGGSDNKEARRVEVIAIK